MITTTGRPHRTGMRLARRALLAELRSYQSIYRFVFRRPRVPAGATGFSHHRPVLAVLIVFIVVSAMEVVVIDLIVHRWAPVRIPLLIVGIWGVTWMVGLLFGSVTRPHSVGLDGLRIRSAEVDVPIGWDLVSTVARRSRRRPDGEPKITEDENGLRTWHLYVDHQTNLEIELFDPTWLRLPHGAEQISRIAIWADDSVGYLDAVRDQLRRRHTLIGQ